MKSEYAIEVQDMVKKFTAPEVNQVNAVGHGSININQGESISLHNPSGCGKTTSSGLMAGFEWPISGELVIGLIIKERRLPFSRFSGAGFT